MRRRGAGLWGPASECAWRVWGPRHPRKKADVAQLAEHVLGKDEVTGSIPVIGSRVRTARQSVGKLVVT